MMQRGPEKSGPLIFAVKEGKMAELIIGGRTIPLSYSTYEMIEIERALGCTAFQLNDKVLGIRQTDEDDPTKIEMEIFRNPDMKENLGKLIRILGNAGLEEAGQDPDLTDRWVLKHMKPSMVAAYAVAAMYLINEGNQMEAKKEEKGPVDEGLEEEEGKKPQGN